ncbi:hypothetical protein [Actinomadura rupiterrae]|uniref:hypothetical protein n=1 Tax=Actinomadura rupiterrae TaxID=559627 RepID=UPI0020A2FE39|nr:hypothetical protein [Actinomadura rupiterrae]MCP2339149.1 hypothetical protein [Actinomadura rupiterrae]
MTATASPTAPLPFPLQREITVPAALAPDIPGLVYDHVRGFNTIGGKAIDPVRLGTWTTTYNTAGNDNKSDEESK